MTKFTFACSQLIEGIVVVLICSCTVSTLHAQSQAGDTLVTISRDSITMGALFDFIESHTIYVFERNGSVNLREIVRVNYNKIPVRKLMASLLKDKPFECSIYGTYIGFRPKAVVPARKETADIRLLYGTVTDKQGFPIYEASVRLHDTRRGTKTDAYGRFWLSDIKPRATISVSCVGYYTYQGTALGDTVFNISLEKLTSSVKTYEVKANKILKDTPVERPRRFPPVSEIAMRSQSNVLDNLIGKEPGVLMQRSSGRSAASVSTEIRGPTSLNKNSQPLYIIDGIPLSPVLKGGEGTMSPYSSTLSYFFPADIDTIIVLKSAAATALYGARGANGVILISTKMASDTGKMHVTADVSYGFGKVPRRERLLDTEEYIQLRWDAWNNDRLQPTPGKAQDMLVWPARYTDWQEELIGHTAYYRDAILTASGRESAVQYRIGANYRGNSTVLMREGNKYGDSRFGLHGNAIMKLMQDKLTISLMGLVNVTNTCLPGADYTGGITLPPNAPPLFENGKINYAVGNSIVAMPDFEAGISNILSTVNVGYRVNSLLNFQIMAGYHTIGNQSASKMTIAKRGEEGQGITASSTENRYRSQTFVVEPTAGLDLRRDSHKLALTLGVTYNSIYADNKTIDASGFRRDVDIEHYERAAMVDTRSTWNRYRYTGAFAHGNYDWKEKYMLEFTVRRDGSSRFGKDERVNFFGGVAAGWDFGKETFVRNFLHGLSDGKIQLGWSATGNDQIEDYQYEGDYQWEGNYQSVDGLVSYRQQNSALTGGITYRKDVTVAFKFLDNRLGIEAAYYHNRSVHQLVEYLLPDMAGGGTMRRNMPVSIQNKGLELTLNALLVQYRHWTLAMRANFARGTNMLLAFPGMLSSPSGETQLKRPVQEFLYYDFYGVDAETGEYLFRNEKGQPVKAAALKENDRTVAINTAPQFYGGFGFTCTIYDFELTCSGQYMKRMAENGIIDKLHKPGTMWNQHVHVKGRWRSAGDNVRIQKATQASSSEADYKKYVNSTAIFTDLWYIRLNNITAAWQSPKFRIYCNVTNLYTFTNYQSLDPETLSRTSLPIPRVVRLGVQYRF
jgi:TonB-linked SusC/RagA family outer membrane protein